MKKLLIGLGATATAIAMVPLFAAFEAHVINVTARIENALEVSTEHIDFGTVFPQEQIDKFFGVALSQSFLDEDRVDDIEYVIRQKPKCWNGDEQNPVYGTVTEGDDGLSFVCADDGFQILPLLCPYLSKHEITEDGTNDPREDTGISAFHGAPINAWDMSTTLATQVRGRLAKSIQDFVDTWKIDLKTPCFGGYCAQDWADYVTGINPQANPDDYVQPIEQEHKKFGCDLWLEVTGVSLPPTLGCEDKLDAMLVLDRSGSIDNTELGVLKSAATAFVNALVPSADTAHIGEVSFSTNASLDVHLTDNAAAVNAAIAALASGGLTNLQEAIDTAKTELDNPGDGHDRADGDSPDYMIIITDGAPTAGGDSGAAAAAAKAAGIKIYVVGVGVTPGTEDFLKNTIATSPDYYFSAADFDHLETILEGLVSCDNGG